MDKMIQNRHRKEGWMGIEEDEEFSPHLAHFRLFYSIAGWNYSKLIFLFLFFKILITFRLKTPDLILI